MTAAATQEAPARRAAPLLRDAVERVFLTLRDLPRKLPRAPLSEALEDAMASLSLWGESALHAEDHLTLLDRATQRVAEAAALIQPAAGASPVARRAARSLTRAAQRLRRLRDETIDRIVADQDRMLRGATGDREIAAPARSFRASDGVPAVHAIPGRPRVAPPVHVDAPVADDDDEAFEEEDDDAVFSAQADTTTERSEGSVAHADYDEVEHVRRLSRDCMEDIAIFGNLRRRLADERWVDVARFEERLLANLDAFVSLGFVGPECARRQDILAALLSWADPGFLDKGRAFASAFVLGCVEGDDAVRAAVLALERAHPATFASYADALSLASSPAIAPAMERLLGGGDARVLALALEILRRRREIPFAAAAVLLGHPEIEVAAAAARCLGHAAERGPAITALVRLIEDDVDDRVTLAAAGALLHQRASEGLGPVRAVLSAELEQEGAHAPAIVREALRYLSLAGGPSDGALVFDVLRLEEEGATAAGWFGDPAHVPRLIDMLEAANEVAQSVGLPTPLEVRVAEALHRITGAPMRVAPSDRPATEVTTDLPVDASVWRAYWEEHGARFPPGQKHRFGALYTPLASLDELSADDTPSPARADCALEVAVTLEGGGRLDLDGWVARQRSQIDALRDQASRSGYAAGQWPAIGLYSTAGAS